MRDWKLAACVVGLIVALTGMEATAMDIVRDGKPMASIVVTGEAKVATKNTPPWCDHYAAEVLATWLGKMSGATLPVVQGDAGKPVDGPAIYIGAAAIEQGLTLDDIESESKEGLRIEVTAERILIAGQSDEATVRAVCRFLEKLGCRYFMDSDYGEKYGWNPDLGKVYPRSPTITIAPYTYSEKPGMLSRRFWGSGYNSHRLWRVWNGDGGVSMSTSHAWQGFVPRKTYFAEHPEYFALRDGKRVSSEWLCTSNAEVRRIFIDRLMSLAAENPTGSFSISPPDNRGYCQCAPCEAQDDPSHTVSSTGAVSMSARFMNFYRAIATPIYEKYPQVTLNFYAYADYTEAPRDGKGVPANLIAWIAPIRYSRYHHIGSPYSPTRQELKQVIDAWSEVAPRIAYRSYNFNLAESTVPFAKLSVWQHDMPYLKAHGCIAVNMETFAAWGLMGPHMYQSLRLMYDPDIDSAALMADFWESFYGPAAGPMRDYWLLIDTGFSTLQSEAGSYYSLHLVYTPETLQRLTALLDQAAAAAAGDAMLSDRVRLARKGFTMAEDYIAWRAHVNAGEMAAAKTISDRMYETSQADQWALHNKTSEYIRRFLRPVSDVGAEYTTGPNRLVAVLPDTWRLAYDPDLQGEAAGFAESDFDDSGWTAMRTYSATLSEQDIEERTTFMWARTTVTVPAGVEHPALVFLDLDCDAAESKLYINGTLVPADQANLMRRRPGVARLTGYLREGENTVALLLDHRKISENALGGIVRPVLLTDAPPPAE